MKNIFSLFTVAFMLLLAGCDLTTLHPIFTPSDLVLENRILGKWQNSDHRFQLEPATQIQADDLPASLKNFRNKFYLFTKDERKSMAFLVKIGKHYFLDLYPIEGNAERSIDPFYWQHKIKMHTIYRLDILNPSSLRMQGLEDSYVKDMITNKQIKISYTMVRNSDSDEESILLTASTKELQQFLLKYGSDSKAYGNQENTIYLKTN